MQHNTRIATASAVIALLSLVGCADNPSEPASLTDAVGTDTTDGGADQSVTDDATIDVDTADEPAIDAGEADEADGVTDLDPPDGAPDTIVEDGGGQDAVSDDGASGDGGGLDADASADATADMDTDAGITPPPWIGRFDFQGESGALARGYTAVTPSDLYNARVGHGFVTAPRGDIDSSDHTWSLWGRTLTIDEVIPASVLSNATRDCVVGGRAAIEFRVDVPPGDYDVTIWLGDVTTPRHQIRATLNDVVVDVERLDINHSRGTFDETMFGNAVPRTVRVSAPDGAVVISVDTHPDGDEPIQWTYDQDEDPNNPPAERTVVLVPEFSAAVLQALTLHSAADPPLALNDGTLEIVSAPDIARVQTAVERFNDGAVEEARAAFESLSSDMLRFTAAAGLFAVAGHPAFIDEERALLGQARALLEAVLADDPNDMAAEDMLLQVRLADDAERYRGLYGYAAAESSATENMGRSCSLVEQFQPDHFYHLKGQILWLRNRGGLDPRRVTASWERAQWLARHLDPDWGEVNPYVHLYATDEWTNDSHPWTVVYWDELAGDGPDWALSLMSNLNAWLDLMEWWAIHRQAPEGDIGGGWTDDVEIVPAFGLVAYVLEDASDILRHSVIEFADGLWHSDVMDREAGYQRQYADVEHTAEPTGNILHLYPLVRFGDPEGIERMLISARTFDTLFLTDGSDSPHGHRHFVGNHLSSTRIANNPNHAADIPLCGRVTAPFPFLIWYTQNPAAEGPLYDWATAWVEDAERAEAGKPAGIFPNLIWTPTDGIGHPSIGNWHARQNSLGQYTDFARYQFYLYSLAGFFYLRTEEDAFRAPFDAAADYAMQWDDLGQPDMSGDPPAGSEDVWAGSHMAVAQGAITNVALVSGLSDWDDYLGTFARAYGQFLLDPVVPDSLELLSTSADLLRDTWPYRTTEGLMTDRIMIPGWADVISYYMGAEVFSVFFGMPVHAVTWQGTSRLFAAAVSETTQQELSATLFLFSEEERTIGMRLWQLELGASYRLEAGPADGLGLAPSSIDQTVDFDMVHLGDGVTFDLPGRTVYALRITQTDPPAGSADLLADIAVAPRDVTYDDGSGQLVVQVHNVGSADATDIEVTAYEGLDDSGTLIGSVSLGSLDAPLDLIPRSQEVRIGYDAASPVVTIVVDSAANVDEITEENNQASAWIDGASPDQPPPMIFGIEPTTASPGSVLDLSGRNLLPDVEVRVSEAPTSDLTLTWIDAQHAELEIDGGASPGLYLVSLENPDGKRSNLIPLTVSEP